MPKTSWTGDELRAYVEKAVEKARKTHTKQVNAVISELLKRHGEHAKTAGHLPAHKALATELKAAVKGVAPAEV
jgi:2-keto-3-deoxy-L-rhamnonate aldolase RhmA